MTPVVALEFYSGIGNGQCNHKLPILNVAIVILIFQADCIERSSAALWTQRSPMPLTGTSTHVKFMRKIMAKALLRRYTDYLLVVITRFILWPKTDISTLTASTLGRLQASLWLMSPSCQPYTVLNPLSKGAADPRAKSFLHIIKDVLPDLVATQSHPQYILVENVAGFEVCDSDIYFSAITKVNLRRRLARASYSYQV
jgi:hypothetical protein